MSRLTQRDIADTLLPAEDMTTAYRFNQAALYADARRLQAEAAADAARMLARGLRKLGRGIVASFRAMLDAVHMQRTVSALYSLDDRTLADIGLKRDEIPLAVQAMLDSARSGKPMPTLAEALKAREVSFKADKPTTPAIQPAANDVPAEELRRAA